MKKIFLITLLSFFISSVSYSQTKDFLRLKCITEDDHKGVANLYYELDFKKSKYILKAHVFNKKVNRSNVKLIFNEKHSKNYLTHLDEELVEVDDGTVGMSHLIFWNEMNALLMGLKFVTGDDKPLIETVDLSCEEVTSFPKFILNEQEKNDNRKVFTLKNCYYTPQQKSFDKNRFDQLDVEVDRIKKKVNLKIIFSDNELRRNKKLSEEFKKNISLIYNIDSDKNNIIKASTIRNNEKEELIINVNKLEINQGKNRLICE